MNTDDHYKYTTAAQTHVKTAEKLLKGHVLTNIFTSKPTRRTKALKHYIQALDKYKLAKNWTEVALVNIECAKLSEQQKNHKGTAAFYAEAGNYFFKVNELHDGLKTYEKAIAIYKELEQYADVW